MNKADTHSLAVLTDILYLSSIAHPTMIESFFITPSKTISASNGEFDHGLGSGATHLRPRPTYARMSTTQAPSEMQTLELLEFFQE